jgi:DNA-binding response OmpR family regulator
MIGPLVFPNAMKDFPILVVDDDPVTCAMLDAWLRHCGAKPLVAGSTAEADAILAAQAVELVLSDVHLPGNQQLRWVQAVLARPEAPAVLLITGNPELETTLRAANLATSGYLVKPLDFAVLEARCREIISARSRRRELLDLSRETARLLDSSEEGAGLDPAVRSHLHRLAGNLSAAADRGDRGNAAADEPWRRTIVDAIAILEKTKHAFRSKDLGILRRRLEDSLRQHRASA